ncbi:MAG: EamA family transporter [Candidatus Binatia bacterium]
MASLSVFLILLSALLHALWNYYSKANPSPQIFLFWVGLFTLGLALCFFAIRSPSIPHSVWIYLVASGLVHFFYWSSLSQAYTSGDISYVYPIARSAPGFVPLFAFLFLGETISAQGLAGIVCIVVSIYLLQQRDEGMTFRTFIRHAGRPDAVWAFSTLGTVIAYSLLDKKGMVEYHAHPTLPYVWQAVTYYCAQQTIGLFLYSAFIIFRSPRREIMKIGHRYWKTIIVSGIFIMISYTLILYVMMTEKVSYVVALRQSSVIFAVLLGGYLLEETHAMLRLVATLVMVIGVLLTSTA